MNFNMRRPTGLHAFAIIWSGQFISQLGTAMTKFSLMLWAWETTGRATTLAFVGLFGFGPLIIIGPLAGVLVDRWNRKLTMMLSDLASGLVTIVLLLLFFSGNLEIRFLYIGVFISGIFEAFQFPAYSAAITLMMPKKHYGRSSGMLSLISDASGVLAPTSAAFLMKFIGLAGIMLIDVTTFMIAIGLLLFVSIPNPTMDKNIRRRHRNFWKESGFGFHYIFSRPSLLGLQLIFFVNNLAFALILFLITAMLLARTSGNQIIVGWAQSAINFGALTGSILLSIWGGPKHKIHGVLLGSICSMIGLIILGMGRSLTVWIIAIFGSLLCIPIVNGSNQAIWQSKIAPDIQGRVFSVRRLIAQITVPIMMSIAGPLSDYFLEPAMLPGGKLEPVFGWLVGSGAGSGMGLIFITAGFIGCLSSLTGYILPIIRNIENFVPDHNYIDQ